MTELHWTKIDGVTTVWTDAPPPLQAGLLFRTGRIDETLVTSGHTHLIEHLAFSALGDPDQYSNGYVGGETTNFYKRGRAEDVISFLERICDALTSLPGDRLEAEKRVLAAEGSTRAHNVCTNLLMWRYGAEGYGQLALAELGIPSATLEQLSERVEQRFTKENALLWLSGLPPSDLRLSLPHGTKHPLPRLSSLLNTFPRFFVDDACGGVATGSIVPRVSGASLFVQLALRRLRKRLRMDQAVSYAPFVFYDPLTADTAHLVLYADSHGEHRKELAREFSEVFVGLGEIEESEIESARSQVLDGWTGTHAPQPVDLMMGELHRAAADWAFEREFESLESLADRLLSVKKDDISTYCSAMKTTAMFALPGEAILQPCYGERAPLSIASVVYGDVAPSIDAPINKERLVSGPAGVSLLFSDGSDCTVRYSDLAGAVYHEDGCVWLIGVDAAMVMVEPTLWRGGKRICREIRARVPDHLVVDKRTRSADAIPKPSTTGWQRFFARLTLR